MAFFPFLWFPCQKKKKPVWVGINSLALTYAVSTLDKWFQFTLHLLAEKMTGKHFIYAAWIFESSLDARFIYYKT